MSLEFGVVIPALLARGILFRPFRVVGFDEIDGEFLDLLAFGLLVLVQVGLRNLMTAEFAGGFFSVHESKRLNRLKGLFPSILVGRGEKAFFQSQ